MNDENRNNETPTDAPEQVSEQAQKETETVFLQTAKNVGDEKEEIVD